ncbi:TIGR00730 family Rossman fold protein [Sulfurovum sp. NBC37-1]|uniref:LOG family protein n=1 Tax=Sulfurovum sp. (strain NBC37-1) TaxID=387093 RepID=UPI001E327E95|nr:TIGR00730 family Rossman fold protein [Sulfurovum sp. NBC37-1]
MFYKIPKVHKKLMPWQHPKPEEEEPEVRERIEAIMRNHNYIEADSDSDFLRRDEVRGVRLEVDYLKTELLLKEHGIEHTIVVFGSTRISEESEIKRRIEKLEESLSDKGDNSDMERELRTTKNLLAKTHYYDTAREFGRLVGNSGKGPDDARVTLMTGGGPGIMEAANRGAFDVGAKTIGLNITLPYEQYPNPYITPELCFRLHYFAVRKMHFLRRAKALVVFPGGFGTMDECFEVLTLVQTRKVDPIPIIFVGESYWKNMVYFEGFVEEGVIDPEDMDIFTFVETAEEAWETILQWYIDSDDPLV